MAKATKRGTKPSGRHLPSVAFTLVHPVDGRVLVLTNDIGHRRVTAREGKDLDSVKVRANRYGKPDIHVFGSRDEVREYVDFRLSAAEAAGFVAIS